MNNEQLAMAGWHESFTTTVPSLNFPITNQRITRYDYALAFLTFQARMLRTFVWTKVPKTTGWECFGGPSSGSPKNFP